MSKVYNLALKPKDAKYISWIFFQMYILLYFTILLFILPEAIHLKKYTH